MAWVSALECESKAILRTLTSCQFGDFSQQTSAKIAGTLPSTAWSGMRSGAGRGMHRIGLLYEWSLWYTIG